MAIYLLIFSLVFPEKGFFYIPLQGAVNSLDALLTKRAGALEKALLSNRDRHSNAELFSGRLFQHCYRML